MVSGLQLAHTLLRTADPLVKRSVVICHGLFGSKQNWRSISRALNKQGCGTICAVDLRNHGDSPRSSDMRLMSMAEDVLLLVEQLKLEDVCLVGHSLGGKVVMCASLTAPERFSKLAVLDISPVYTSRVNMFMPYLRLMQNADFYRAERESDGNLGDVRQWLSNEWKKYIPDESVRSFLLTNLDMNGKDFVWRVNFEAISSGWHSIVGFPRELQNHTFDRSTLFLAGGRSDYIKISDFPMIQRYFPQAKLLRMQKCGHWIQADDPHTLLNVLSHFIQGPAEQMTMDFVDDLTAEALQQQQKHSGDC